MKQAMGVDWTSARETLSAEWTKLRTTPGTGWLLLGIIAVTVALSALATAAQACPAGTACQVDTVKVSLTGIELGQAVVAMLAVLAISGEYSTGMIRITFAAMPHRSAVLAAKAVLITCLVLAAGSVAVLGCLLAGRLILPGHGFNPAHGYRLLSLANGPTLRAAAGSVLYLALIALLSLGAAAAVRDGAAAIGTVLGVLYIFPILAAVIPGQLWQHRIERYTPMNAGLAIQATTGLRSLVISPWAGLGVLVGWACAALLAGGLLLALRDA